MDKLFKLLQKPSVTTSQLEDLLREFTAFGDDGSTTGRFDINEPNKRGETALCLAIQTGDPDIVKCLLDVKGIDVNSQKGASGWSPLLFSIIACQGPKEIVALLLQKKASITICDLELGYNALHWAAKVENVPVMKLLLARGSKINQKSGVTEETALHVAIEECNEEAAKFLLERDADVNSQNKGGETPLHVSVRQLMSNISSIILNSDNLDVSICVDAAGNSPLHFAREQRLDGLSRLLESKGFSSSQKNRAGVTPDDIIDSQNKEKEDKTRRHTEASKDKAERQRRQQEESMNNTEVTMFLKQYELPGLIETLFKKKFKFLDQDFLTVDDTRLRKMGLTPDERLGLLQAIEKREQDIEFAARKLEREEHHREMMGRRWRQLVGVVGIVLVFICVFLFLKLVEKKVFAPRKPPRNN